MAQVENGDTVKVHYTGRLTDGTVFDSSREGDPLEFTLGEGQLIAGFEEAVLGMEVGQTKEVQFPPEMAYGPRFDEMVHVLDRERLPPDLDLEVGRQLLMSQPDGEEMVLTIIAIEDSEVTVDANHPLAGQDLIFDIELMEIGVALPADGEE
jgi:FKBP-type peptidyl-prolyl cis-trans isomerase 2